VVLSNGAKILVVDDDPINRDILASFLLNEGYDVLCKEDGESALKAMPSYLPDLVLLDIMMPGIDGFEVTSRLKSSKEYQHIPVVLQTGLDDRDSCLRALNLGAEDYITKPIDSSELLARVRNLLRLKRFNDLLAHNNRILADYDSITGLPNRKLLARLLEKTIDTNRTTLATTGLILISTHNFKEINKTLGSSQGDMILQEMTKRLMHAGDEHTQLGHISSDLFAVIVNGPELNVVRYAKQMQKELQKPFILANKDIFLNCYMGISFSPRDGTDGETVYRHADIARGKAKELAVVSHRIFSPGMDVGTIERMSMEQDLYRALQYNDFTLQYQPQVDLFSGYIKSAEALIRWNHPKQGNISPAEFIPLAEQCGLILPITQWVLITACEQAKRWQELGYSNMTIAVNISSQHFQSGLLVVHVTEALRKSRLSAKYLELEITEGVMVDDVDKVLITLNQLKEMGVKLAIDDFGTGYSSLGYLQRLPVDRIKIDQSFISNITSNLGNAVIARSIIAMSHQFNYKVIAEGVETEAQLGFLLRHHCDEIQGYYFSRPVSHDDFSNLLEREKRIPVEVLLPNISKRTLLIVDDDINAISSLRRLLRLDGYDMLVASSGEEALELLARNTVRVVIADQHLPKMRGTEFLSQVRNMYPETVRLLITGYGDLNTAVEAINTGMIHKFHTKPWNEQHLRENIKDSFQQQEMARELMQLRLKLHKAQSK